MEKGHSFDYMQTDKNFFSPEYIRPHFGTRLGQTAPLEVGEAIFNDEANCASCHVPPLFTEPGNNLHAPNDIGAGGVDA
jgi:hypothetical protein